MKREIKKTELWTAIITPFDAEKNIDWESFEKLMRMQDDAGNGVVILGSTGEALSLSLAERKELVEKSLAMNLKSPIMAGVGGIDLLATLDWLKWCEARSLDGYLMVTPLYAKPGPKGQTGWFRALLDTVTKPCMLYNVPSRTGVKLASSVLADLKDHPNLWALKEASGALEDFQTYRRANSNIAIYSGEDSLMPFLASLGARGLVSVAANVWPRETSAYVKAAKLGDHSSLLPLWSEASAALFAAANPIPVKSLMHEKQLIKTNLVRPPLDTSDYTDLQGLISHSQKIKNWWEEKGEKYV